MSYALFAIFLQAHSRRKVSNPDSSEHLRQHLRANMVMTHACLTMTWQACLTECYQ